MFRLGLPLLGSITSCLVPSLGKAVLFLLADELGACIVKIFVGFWVGNFCGSFHDTLGP